MTRYPICRMMVDEVTSLRTERDGATFHFCSDHCRQRFLSAPSSATHDEGAEHRGRPAPAHGHSDGPPARSSAPYFCPMCPGVESERPGDCPKCGMTLERNPASVAPATPKPLYTCPMHPEVQQDHPGDCPKCGMTLVLKTPTASPDHAEDAELRDMTRRFWIGVALTVPVFVLAMAHVIPVLARQSWADSYPSRWIQFALTTPVVWWRGWPFFRHGWRSVVTGQLNMFTLIAIGVGRGVRLQRRGHARARPVPAYDAPRGKGHHLLQSRRGDRCPRPSWSGARAPGPQPHRQRHQGVAESCAAHGTTSRTGGRSGGPTRPSESRRLLAESGMVTTVRVEAVGTQR